MDDIDIPRWLHVVNGGGMMCYYTLDCMDGKQARRTKLSSPLGQLFDHGMDCICNLSHLQLVQCMLLLPPHLLLVLQSSLQFSFWQAQWEEYYTGILPHAAGNFGVTEVNYGLGLWSIITGLFLGREFYDLALYEFPTTTSSFPGQSFWLGTNSTTTTTVIQVKHVASMAWVVMMLSCIILSWMRVYKHLQGDTRVFISAMSKFLSPLILTIVALLAIETETTGIGSSSSSPPSFSLALGLCFCVITIKLIVYSMARMAYASLQFDMIPFIVVLTVSSGWREMGELGALQILWGALDLFYLLRLGYWIHAAIAQLCDRLQIKLFRIPYDPVPVVVVASDVAASDKKKD
jgi:hypothetical protein